MLTKDGPNPKICPALPTPTLRIERDEEGKTLYVMSVGTLENEQLELLQARIDALMDEVSTRDGMINGRDMMLLAH